MYIPLLREIDVWDRDAGWQGRRRGSSAVPGEAEDFEMRDVRRDGLIEALLIAFTPPRGLPYPRVYPRFVTLYLPSPRRSPAEVVSGPYSGRERLNATFYLPSFTLVLRHLSSSPRYNFSPSSSRLASRTFRLHSM